MLICSTAVPLAERNSSRIVYSLRKEQTSPYHSLNLVPRLLLRAARAVSVLSV